MDNVIESSSDSDTDDENPWLVPLIVAVAIYQQQRRIGSNRLWTGQEYTDNLLNCGNSIRIRNQLRMELDTFYQLRDWLVGNTKLDSSQGVSVEERLVIFIFITSSGASNRKAQEQFNRSSWTISQ
jgi:hypothetical protein